MMPNSRYPALIAVVALSALLPIALTTGQASAVNGTRHAGGTVKTQPGEIGTVQAAGHSHDLWAITDIENGQYSVARQHLGVWHTLPNTEAYDDGQLFSIAAPTASAVWVAGDVTPPNGTEQPVIYRWNGTRLVSQTLPSLVISHSRNATIDSISAASANDGWAVSDATFAGRDHDGRPSGPVALHWNGTRWKSIRTAQPLISVVDIRRGNAWAIAANSDLYHWNGSRWRLGRAVPRADELLDISASSGHNVIAVGDNNATTSDEPQANGSYILRYDGRKWSRMPFAPRLHTAMYVRAVTVVGKSAWAVGLKPSSFGLASVILHSAGGRWAIQQTVDENHYLADVTASSATRVFAAGNASGAETGGTPTYLERYDGKRWHRISSKF